uniref:Gamma-tubulin complex component n=1 Tax=Panagrellus redivivus TaxID=6233 RepID=A0A7E4WDN8_PANRE
MCFSLSLCLQQLSADGCLLAAIAPLLSQKETADTFLSKTVSVVALKMILVLISLILSLVTPNIEMNDDVDPESMDFVTNESMIQEELANPSGFDDLLRYCDSDDDVTHPDDESVVHDNRYANFRNILNNPEGSGTSNDDPVANGSVRPLTPRSNEYIPNNAALQNNSSSATMTHSIIESGMPHQPVHICPQVNDEVMDLDAPDNSPSTSSNNVSNFCHLCHADARALWCPFVNQNLATTPKVETRGRPEEENVTEGAHKVRNYRDILKELDRASKPFLLKVLQCGVQHGTIIRNTYNFIIDQLANELKWALTLSPEAYTDVDENGVQLGHPIVCDDERHANSRERNAAKSIGICYRLLTVVLKQLETVCPKTYNMLLSEIEGACGMLHADIVGGKRRWKL